jgi:hypothetical protein
VYESTYGGEAGLRGRLAGEFQLGLGSLASADFASGPMRFAAGAGRHGAVARL